MALEKEFVNNHKVRESINWLGKVFVSKKVETKREGDQNNCAGCDFLNYVYLGCNAPAYTDCTKCIYKVRK